MLGGGGGGVSHPSQLTTGLVIKSVTTSPTLAGERMLFILQVSILSEQITKITLAYGVIINKNLSKTLPTTQQAGTWVPGLWVGRIKGAEMPRQPPRVTRQNTELRSVKTECVQRFVFFFFLHQQLSYLRCQVCEKRKSLCTHFW